MTFERNDAENALVLLVGHRIRKIRKDNVLTQKEIAHVMGVRRSIVSRYERGILEPGNYKMLKFCDHFEMSINELVRW